MRNLLFGLFAFVIVAIVAESAQAQVQVNNYYPGSVGYSRVGYGYNGYGYANNGYQGGGYYGSYYGPNVYGPNVYGGVGYTSSVAPRVYTYGGPGLYPSRFRSGFGGYGGAGGYAPRVQYRYGY